MHTNSNPGLITLRWGCSNSLATDQRPHTHHKFYPSPENLTPLFHPLHPQHFIPKKAPIFSTYITDFRTSLFSSLLELSIFCHMTLIAFAVPLFRALSLFLILTTSNSTSRPPSTYESVCVRCKSNKTKKYSPENMKRNTRRFALFGKKTCARTHP